MLKCPLDFSIITCSPNYQSTSYSTTYSTTSGSSKRPGDKPTAAKNDPDDNDGPSDEERDNGGARKRSRKDEDCVETPGTAKKTWVCPFFRRNPVEHHACLERTFQKVTHVKEHICLCHVPAAYCSICWEEFSSESARDRHTRTQHCNPVSERMGVDLTDEEQRSEFRRNRIPEGVEGWNKLWEVSLSRVFPKPTRSGRTPRIRTDARYQELLETTAEIFFQEMAGDTVHRLREAFPEVEGGRIDGINWLEVVRIVSGAFVNFTTYAGRSPRPRMGGQPSPARSAAQQVAAPEDSHSRPSSAGDVDGVALPLPACPSVAISTTAPSNISNTETNLSSVLHYELSPSTTSPLPKPTRHIGDRSSSAPSAIHHPPPSGTHSVKESPEQTRRPALRQSVTDTTTYVYQADFRGLAPSPAWMAQTPVQTSTPAPAPAPASTFAHTPAQPAVMHDVLGTLSTALQQPLHAQGSTTPAPRRLNL